MEWKSHLMVPVFKSGDKANVTNYRPISLLCTVSKVLERLIYQNIIEYIRPLLSPHQFGFLENRSCVHKLLSLLNDVTNSLDLKYQTDVVFLDLRKAFDTVCHQELLFKMLNLGISGPLWRWFCDYLSNRVHQVRLNGAVSSVLHVKSGVPQGSILGPLLFLIYINDMVPTVTFSRILLYADDSECFKAIHSNLDCDLLQQDLNSLVNWSSEWNMTFNASKCVHMRFGSVIPDSGYSLNGCNIVTTAEHKDVGVVLTSNMSFSTHLNQILSKAYRSLGMIRRLVPSNSNTDLKRSLYLSLVRSHLVHCSQVWRPYLTQDSRT